MSNAAGAAVRELPGYDNGREDERTAVIDFIRQRGATAIRIGAKGHRLTEAEGTRLDRWLSAVADDLAAQLHVDD